MLALDRGPGVADFDRCLRDGYSTGGSAGQGLGAIMRMSKESDFYSDSKKGTVVLARWYTSTQRPGRPSGVQTGAVNIPKPGQEVCGDSWRCAHIGDRLTVLMADGLGHGYEAQVASLEAVRQFEADPGLAPKALIERCHLALRSTRGAAVAVAHIDYAHGKLTYCGAGNLSARIYSGSKPLQHLVSVHGTAGQHTERLQEFSYRWPEDGLLIFHSDGLSSHTGIESYPGLAQRDPSLIAGVLYRDFARGNDDATVFVAKAA